MAVQRSCREVRRLVGAFAMVFGWSAVSAADLFDTIHQRGRALEATLKTLTARFTETSGSTLLDRPLVLRGTVTVVRPFRIRLDYLEPDPRTVVIDGPTLSLVWPSRGLSERKDVGAAQRRVERYFLTQSPDGLREHFTITAADAHDRPGTWLLRMTPKRKQIQEGLSDLDLWVDRSTVMLNAMRMAFPNGDTKLMEFEDVRINPEVDAAVFRLPVSR